MIALGLLVAIVGGFVIWIGVVIMKDTAGGLIPFFFGLFLVLIGGSSSILSYDEDIKNAKQEGGQYYANEIGNGRSEIELYKTEITDTDTTYFFQLKDTINIEDK